MALVESLDTFFMDQGVPATVDGDSRLVIFDVYGVDVLSGRAASTDYEMTYQSADFPTLAFGALVTIGAVTYRVINTNPIDDGAFSKAVLEVP